MISVSVSSTPSISALFFLLKQHVRVKWSWRPARLSILGVRELNLAQTMSNVWQPRVYSPNGIFGFGIVAGLVRRLPLPCDRPFALLLSLSGIPLEIMLIWLTPYLLRVLRRRVALALEGFDAPSSALCPSSSGSSVASTLCSFCPLTELPSKVPLRSALCSRRLETSFNCERLVVLVVREVLAALVSRVEAGDERGSTA